MASFRDHKEWAYRRVGIARVYPFLVGCGVGYSLKYMLKGNTPWKWRVYHGDEAAD